MKSTVIVIAGPTASGKTSLSIDIAQYFQTEIISADSRQCYKEMTIGTAVPSLEELARVRHHFIHSHSIHQPLTAGKYMEQARTILAELFQKNEVVVVTGGTGRRNRTSIGLRRTRTGSNGKSGNAGWSCRN